MFTHINPSKEELNHTTMSPQAGELLVQEIAPRIRNSVSSVSQIGIDDVDELVQDAVAIAASMLISAESRQQKVTPGNVAYYAVGLIRQGRRSTGVRKNDVLHPACQLTGHSRVISMEESIGSEFDDDSAMTLHDVLSAQIEDPAYAASRNIDWERLIESLDKVCKEILRCLSEGIPLTELKAKLKRSRSALQQDKERLADLVLEHFGADILVQVQEQPRWRDNIEASREKTACRYERHPA